jgi:hypothetical protein
MKYHVQTCPQADREHRESKRQYAHVHHRRGNVVCVCRAFFRLPWRIRLGLLLHEIGHLIDPDETNELAVDRLAEAELGIKIYRRDFPRYGDDLECVHEDDIAAARDALGLCVGWPGR